jgi:hypothetical protein
MAATVLTTEDLMEFKVELLQEFKELLKSQSTFQLKKWLRSPEVRDLLDISPGTLQNLRINGTLPYTKMGGVIYYEYADILKVMQTNRVHHK